MLSAGKERTYTEMRGDIELVLIFMPVVLCFLIYVAVSLYCGFVKGKWFSPGTSRSRGRRHHGGWGGGGGAGGVGGGGMYPAQNGLYDSQTTFHLY